MHRWLVVVAACSAGGPPTDGELRALVHARPADLAELREMIAAEPTLKQVGHDAVGDCWRFPDGWSCSGFHPADEAAMLAHVGLAPARWDRYQTLLARVVSEWVWRDGDGVGIAVASWGLSVSGGFKGLYAGRVPALVADTDLRPNHYATTYADAGDGWYIVQSTN